MVVVNSNYLIKARLPLGRFFGVPDDDAYIELREPDTKTTFRLNASFTSGDNEKIIHDFVEILPGLITSHNLMKSESEAHTATEVAAIVEQKLELFLYVLEEYKEKVIFTLGKKSGGK